MGNDWIKVFTTGKMFTAELIKGMLAEKGIACTIMNQKDSELLFGDISLFVSATDEMEAKKLINERNKAE
jgi:hypothetical protein